MAYICTHPTISVEVAALEVVRVVTLPRGTVRTPAELMVVDADPPKETLLALRTPPKELVVVAEVEVELAVIVRLPTTVEEAWETKPWEVKRPAEETVVLAVPPKAVLLAVNTPLKRAVLVAEVVVELPVTVKLPPVEMFVLMVVAASTASERTNKPNTTPRTTEMILVVLSLLIMFILKLFYFIYPTNMTIIPQSSRKGKRLTCG